MKVGGVYRTLNIILHEAMIKSFSALGISTRQTSYTSFVNNPQDTECTTPYFIYAKGSSDGCGN